ncbi:MAG: hypothetical protein HY758_10020 [Nitrospirae bacterium]|nr:hypothetical protein [Nitrospirota bacterium]
MLINKDKLAPRIFWITIFSISMGFAEAAVVVYLRRIYYPEGFSFPLKPLDHMIGVEVFRELATIFMLLSIAMLSGRKLWERFAYFMYCFGVWDIFYYIWLKVLIDWPVSIFDWDILFLIPLPWIGPVIAPVFISILMIVAGILIIYLFHRGYDFRPSLTSHMLALAGTAFLLFSFMHDTGASLHEQMPAPYKYVFLVIAGLLYSFAFIVSYLKTVKHG